MPLFEYQCRQCRHQFELLVRASTRFECPSCHGTDLDKQVSVFAVSAPGAPASARADGPAPCGSCGHPGGPGSCSPH